MKDNKNIQSFEDFNESTENLILSDDIEHFIQDEAIKYINQYKWDSLKESGIAYSSFLNGCRYILLNKDKSIFKKNK